MSQTVSVGGRTNRPGGVPPPAGATKSLSTRDAHVSMIGGALDPATGLTLDWMNTPATATERAPVPPHRSNRPVPDRTAPTAMTRSQAFRRSAPAELARTPHQSRATQRQRGSRQCIEVATVRGLDRVRFRPSHEFAAIGLALPLCDDWNCGTAVQPRLSGMWMGILSVGGGGYCYRHRTPVRVRDTRGVRG